MPSAGKHATDAKRGKMRVTEVEAIVGSPQLFLNGLVNKQRVCCNR